MDVDFNESNNKCVTSDSVGAGDVVPALGCRPPFFPTEWTCWPTIFAEINAERRLTVLSV